MLCICAWISFPIGDISITLQTFGLFLALSLLGGKHGTLVCLAYLLLGAVGLPVFSGFRGGIGMLMGATGGYLTGFLGAALMYWLITGCFGTAFRTRFIAMLVGLTVCYAFGTLWFQFAFLQKADSLSTGLILLKCVLPYVIPDLIKLTAALLLSRRIRRHITF